ncbi:MAG: hypothetical protein ACE5JX_20675 [Acidobacteriota bacterium]
MIDTATDTLVATVPVGTEPGGVAVHPDGSLLAYMTGPVAASGPLHLRSTYRPGVRGDVNSVDSRPDAIVFFTVRK